MKGEREAEQASYGLLVRLASCVTRSSPSEVAGGANPYRHGFAHDKLIK